MAFCTNCGHDISDQAVDCPRCGQPTGKGSWGSTATSVTTSEFAEWWQRFAAAIVDVLVVGIPSVTLKFLLARAPGPGLVVSVACVFGAILYRVVLEGGPRGQTVGKTAMKIKVQDATSGDPIGYGRALVRWFVAGILWAVLYLPGLLDVLFPLWDARRQTLHDKAANSVVVRVA